MSDAFWERVEPLIPERRRESAKDYVRKPGGGRKPKEARLVFEALWKAGLAEYDDFEGIAWRWQSIDGAMMKAPLAQEAVGPNPTDRGKKWEQAPPAGGRSWRPALAHRDRSQST